MDDPMLINADRKKELFQTRNSGSNNRFNKLWGEYVTGSGQPQPYLRKYFQNEIAAGYGYQAGIGVFAGHVVRLVRSELP